MRWIRCRGKRIPYHLRESWVVVAILVFLCLTIHSRNVYGASDEGNAANQIYYSNGLMIQIEAGYDDIVRLGRDSSIYVRIHTLDSLFQGNVILSFPDASGDTVSYSKQVMIDQNVEEEIVFTIPIINLWGSYSLEIRDHYDTSFFSKEFPMEIAQDMEQCYVGILSDSPENLSYLHPENSVVQEIDLERLHTSLTDLEQFDILVVDDFDLDRLDQDLFELLIQWVKEGGTLVLGTGDAYEKTLGRLEGESLLDLKLQGSTLQATTLGLTQAELAELEVKQGSREELSKESLWIQIVDFEIEGSEILLNERKPLVEAVSLEDGKLEVFHIKLGETQMKHSVISEKINQLISQGLSPQRQEKLEYSMYDCNVDFYRMNVVKESSDITVPSIGSFVAIIIVYLLVSGPVLYFVLTKFNRQKSIWRILPLISIAFLGLVVLCGGGSRSKRLKSSYFSIQYYNEEQIQEYSVFNLTVPYHDEFSIHFDSNMMVEAINGKDYGYYLDTLQELEPNSIENYTRRITEETNGSQIDLQNMTSYSTKYFKSYQTYELPGEYESSIEFSPEGFTGSFSNGFDCDLNSAFLISNGSIVSLGDVHQKETVSIQKGEGIPILSMDYEQIANYVRENIDLEEQEMDENINAVNYIVQECLNSERNISVVISFLPEGVQQGVAKDLNEQSVSSGLEMLVLPVEIDSESIDGTLVYDLGRDYEILEGAYMFGNAYRLFNGTLTLEYQLPLEDTITALYYSGYSNCSFNEERMIGFSGNIYLYNRVSGTYDELVQDPKGKVEDLSAYLSEDNKIIVKYSEKNEYLDYYMSLPYLSYYKEAK